jgi:sugar phosphate isomerase/epimerase
MEQSWRAFMHLGIVHFMIYPSVMGGEGPMVETARQIAADDFFNVLEITKAKDPVAKAALKNLFEVSGLIPGMAGQPSLLMNKLNLADLDEDGRKAAVNNVKETIDYGYYYGSRITAILDGPGSYPGPDKKQRAIERLIVSLKQLCEYAEDQADDYLMYVSLETFDQAVDKKSLIGPSADAALVAEEVKKDHPNFGLTIDLSHLPVLGESSAYSLQTVKDHLIHAHVGNAAFKDRSHPAFGDNHPRFDCYGGENGVAELTEFLRELMKVGFFAKKQPTAMPVVTFEVKPMPGEDSDLVIASTKRTFKEAWAKV